MSVNEKPNINKNGLIGQMLERILILESRLNEIENKNEIETNTIKKYYSIEDFSKATGYSKHTLYKKIKLLQLNVHYFYSKGNSGKLLFDESAVDFLVKGGNNNGESIQETRQSVCVGKLFGRQKKV